jgi:hypothetical protein
MPDRDSSDIEIHERVPCSDFQRCLQRDKVTLGDATVAVHQFFSALSFSLVRFF